MPTGIFKRTKQHRERIARARRNGLSIEEAFWNKVKKYKNCWEWTGCLSHGYGSLKVNGKRFIASRFSYELHYGKIPKGKFVLHKCDNPACIRPEHLFLGTQKDNVRDSVSKGRNMVGEKQNFAKLTNEKVIEIRSLYSKGNISQTELGKKFNVHQHTISCLVRRQTWKHI